MDADGRRLYRVRVATLDGGPVRTSAGYSVLPEHDASILADGATVVVPGYTGGPAMTEGTVPAERRRRCCGDAAGSARMVSICTGAFVLAAAGLLDGRPADHALAARRGLRRLFPPSGWTPTCCSSTTATC